MKVSFVFISNSKTKMPVRSACVRNYFIFLFVFSYALVVMIMFIRQSASFLKEVKTYQEDSRFILPSTINSMIIAKEKLVSDRKSIIENELNITTATTQASIIDSGTPTSSLLPPPSSSKIPFSAINDQICYGIPPPPNTNDDNITIITQKVLTKPKGEWSYLCKNNFLQAANQRLVNGEHVNLIQIGAHVGFERNDPFGERMAIYLESLSEEEKKRFHWTFVEPSPPNFKRLSENIKEYSYLCDMKAVNAAVIADSFTSNSNSNNNNNNNNDNNEKQGQRQSLTFYTISETIDPVTGFDSRSRMKFPHWITQVSSFSKEPILSNKDVWTRRGLNVHDYIVEVNVTAIPYSELIEQIVKENSGNTGMSSTMMTTTTTTTTSDIVSSNASAEAPLFVLIDTEGFDCMIVLGMSETSAYLPFYLIFEVNQCGDLKQPAYDYLKGKMGYILSPVGGTQNAFAIRKG